METPFLDYHMVTHFHTALDEAMITNIAVTTDLSALKDMSISPDSGINADVLRLNHGGGMGKNLARAMA